MARLRLGLLAITLLAPLTSACNRAAPPAARPADAFPLPQDADRLEAHGNFGGRIVHPLLRSPRSYNPLAASDDDTALVTSLIHATLLEMDRNSMQIVPGVAKSWKIENGGRSVRLALRNGVRFSDGSELTADDVLATLDAIYQINSHNSRKDDLTLNGQPIKYSRVSAQEVLLDFPFVYAPALYLISTIPILPQRLLQSTSSQTPVETLLSPDTRPEQCVGLGPFRLKRATAAESVILERNPHYWKVDASGKRLPYVDQLALTVVSNRDSAFMQFRSGLLDMIDRLRTEDYLSLTEKPSELLRAFDIGASTRLDLLWVNQNDIFKSSKSVYFRNPFFRQALARAIDREAMVRNVYHGKAELLSQLWPPSLRSWLADIPGYVYDPGTAAALFQKAGLKTIEQNGRKQLLDAAGRPLTLTLLTNASSVKEAIATMLQQDLRRVGIELLVSQTDNRAVIDRFLNRRDYEAVLFTIYFPPEPTDLQSVLKSAGEQHMWHPTQKTPATRWEADIDRLMDEMVTIPDLERRRKAFSKIQHVLMEQLPVIPLTSERVLVGARRDVKNLHPSVLPPYLLWNAWELSVN